MAAIDGVTVSEALGRHYAKYGLPADGGETAAFFHVHIGRVVIPVPNPPVRQRAVFYHDVNHVAAGYDTVFTHGEMIIAGFELGAGCGPYAIAWLINLFMFGLGLVFCPREMFRAFVRGRSAESVYRKPDRARIRSMTVAELRAELGLLTRPPAPTARDYVLFMGWALAALLVPLTSVALLLTSVAVLV